MKNVFSKPELTCVQIEQSLGLERGDVTEISISPDGTIEVDTAIELTPTQKSEMLALFDLSEQASE